MVGYVFAFVDTSYPRKSHLDLQMPVLRKGDAAKLLRKDLGRRLLIWEMRKSENAPLLPSELL